MYFLVKTLFLYDVPDDVGKDGSKDYEHISGSHQITTYSYVKLWRNWQVEYSEIIALLGAFLMSISPWQIQFSRTAFETNTGLTFNLLVALFFLKGLRKPWLLSLAALFAALNLAVYQSERVVYTPSGSNVSNYLLEKNIFCF